MGTGNDDLDDDEKLLAGDRMPEQHSRGGSLQSIQVTDSLEDGGGEALAPPYRKFAIKILSVVCLFMLLVILLEIFAKETVTRLSKRLMDSIGLPGLYLFVFLADGLPQPFTYVPLIFCAVKAQVPKPVVFGVCAAGSYSAALFGYGMGAFLRQLQCGEHVFARLSEHSPWMPGLMQRRGAIGVGTAALLPIPLALATWTAGFHHVDFGRFLLAGMFRMPKILLFVLLSGAPIGGGAKDPEVDRPVLIM